MKRYSGEFARRLGKLLDHRTLAPPASHSRMDAHRDMELLSELRRSRRASWKNWQ